MSYWMHRVEKHYNGLDILFQEKRLTIGFSDCAKDDSFFADHGIGFCSRNDLFLHFLILKILHLK